MKKEISLAINGGKPVRDTYLPYGRQWIDETDIEAVVNVLKGDFLTTGPVISKFEQSIADYVGSKYAVAFSNGTAALHAACFAAGISEGDEVITTPMTFAASANCILYQGGKPVFADINPYTYNIDPVSIERAITEKTKCIIPVDFTGQPADLDTICQIAHKYNLTIIEDAAHALGAEYKGRKIGSISDMTMFSFHPVKHITTGEGGVITTNNTAFYEKLIQFRSHGITRNPKHFIHHHGPWYYEMHCLGFNYRMTDIQAALGISQLRKLDGFIKMRKHLAALYDEAFRNMKEVVLPFQNQDCNSSWHLYIIRLNLDLLQAGRKEIFEALQKENIGVNVHYIPAYYHPFYQMLDYQKGLCPNAEKLYEEIITLPLFPLMTEADIQDVIEAVKKVITHYSAEGKA
ncbi:MAG TPA: UDP-4-amino-4,6-dideoxy-N-acetyl-beta-L-altrosamine transaminase [Bacillus sp. (in: firmicutes)]|uniref:UDP-4-amino-4, 6-dideoxy-N-acetyl-beta-L-altrosamine transaminase n=1 Tax=Bacillus litorisediminis TaxID=2922713 RepID=UPI001FAE115C|nr:UDP-4-amino-4,6-dideoxy-N-acetyl-beta-L-altrosamine transaminase [Bacillus litorisediminis]HWO75378.1 UDP-4-amino-4,6-dideoxy-N-acetyl-beta-L-altrosamine transaminase [Bacillus sp. (in: firmicutes)]